MRQALACTLLGACVPGRYVFTSDAGVQDALGDHGTSVAVPRPVAPPSGTSVVTTRPTLRWTFPPDAPAGIGVRIELCKDRACAQISKEIQSTGASIHLSDPLPAGTVFWRVFG